MQTTELWHDGVLYQVPIIEPPSYRRLDTSDSDFASRFTSYLGALSKEIKHVEFKISDGRRNLTRQLWLYAQGRVAPFKHRPIISWTLDSRHRWGLAADIFMVRKDTKEIIWKNTSYAWVYSKIPPRDFGLTDILPKEYVHLEHVSASILIASAKDRGLRLS
jgi:hypothetical protein